MIHEFPVFIVTDPDGVHVIESSEHGTVLPIFTAVDLADRFIRDERPGLKPVEVMAEELAEVVQKSANSVVIDLDGEFVAAAGFLDMIL
jgi:hypothetical protein